MLTVSGTPPAVNPAARMRSRMRSATLSAVSRSVSTSRTTNSSPPYRAAMSMLRTDCSMTWATSRSTASPALWPLESL